MLTWDDGMDALSLFFLIFILCVICSDVSSPPSQRSGALWVKLHPETYNSASVSVTTLIVSSSILVIAFAKSYTEWMDMLYGEAAAVISCDYSTSSFT